MAWRDLPVDLLSCIASQLPLADSIRFSVVCTLWNSAFINNAHYQIHNPPSPWLLLPSDAGEDSDALTFRDFTIKEGGIGYHRRFSSLTSHISGRRCFGSKDGWLVILDKMDMQPRLFNPLTKAEISLPSLFTIPEDNWHRIKPRYNCEGSVRLYYNEIIPEFGSPVERFRDIYIQKIVLSSNDQFGTAVVIYGYIRLLALAKPNEQTWVHGPLLPPYHRNQCASFDDVYYHEEERRFYAITSSSAVLAFDLNGQNVDLICPPIKKSDCVYTKNITILLGSVLKIERKIIGITNDERCSWKTTRISVFKLVSHAADSFSKWISIKDLGGYSLFIGFNNTISLHHTMTPEIEPNCIYFSDGCEEMSTDDFDRDAGMFDLQNGSFKYFLNFDSQPNWPTSIWFIPSLS